MDSRIARSFWSLSFILAPLAVRASELDHVTSILKPFFIIVTIGLIGLVTLGFSTKFLVWPKSSSLAGILARILLILGILAAIGIYILLVHFGAFHTP